MKRNLLAAAVMAASLTQLAGCQVQTSAETLNKVFEFSQQNAPADTILYLQSKHLPDAEGAYDLTQLQSALSLYASKSDSMPPALMNVKAFLDRLSALEDQSPDTLLQRFGLETGFGSVVYLDGLAPVMHLSVADSEQFLTGIRSLSDDNELEEVKINNQSVLVMHLAASDEPKPSDEQIYLAARVSDGIGTVTLFTDRDSDQVKQQRLALAKESASLLDTHQVKQLKDTYQYHHDVVGFIDLVQLATSLLKPEQKRAGQDLLAHNINTKPDDLIDVCADDLIRVAGNTPRIVMGMTDIQKEGDAYTVDVSATLEIANTDVRNQLIKLNGHLDPSVFSSQALLSLSLGANVDNFVTVMTGLTGQIKSASFECPSFQAKKDELVDEETVKKMATFSALASGLRGASVELFNVDMDAKKGEPSGIDALITAYSKNPQQLLNLSAMLNNTVNLPDDGTVVDLEMPEAHPLIQKLELKAAKKENTLLMLSGETSLSSVQNASKVELNQKGILGLRVDYASLRARAAEMQDILADSEKPSSAGCSLLHTTVVSITPFSDYADLLMGFDEQGFTLNSSYKFSKAQTHSFEPGTYHLESLSRKCAWEYDSEIEFKDDGTASFTRSEEPGSCPLSKVESHWTKTGPQMAFTIDRVTKRKDCSAEWSESKLGDLSCVMVNLTKESFECRMGDDHYMRFTRQ
jgi:hypothetical protein